MKRFLLALLTVLLLEGWGGLTAQAQEKRIFVGYGQGGVATSWAVPGIADRMKPYGKVTLHTAGDVGSVIAEINREPKDSSKKFVLWGYSLSASYMGDYLCRMLNPNRWLDLMVALDPTRQYSYAKTVGRLENSMFGTVRDELAPGAQPTHSAPCFQRVISFHNPGAWPFGGAVYVGKNVEYRRLPWTTHIGAQFDGNMQNLSVEAVKND